MALLWNIDLTRPGKSIHIIFKPPSYRIQLKKHVKDSGDKNIERISSSRKKDTLSAENIREGTVKGKRLGPPLIICFFTVHII